MGLMDDLLERLSWSADLIIRTLPPSQHGQNLFLNMISGTYFNAPSIKAATPIHHSLASYTPSWSGFLAGKLWLLSDLIEEERYQKAAVDVTMRTGDTANIVNVDTSFAVYHSACLGYQLTGNTDFLPIIKRGVASFTQLYNRDFGGLMIGTPERRHTPYETLRPLHEMEFIIDNGEVMDLLWWAGRDDPCYRRMAKNTVTKLVQFGFVKPNGSTYQCLSLDPETFQPLEYYTRQGYSNDSCWARGQAWAMISFSTAYEATGDELFLKAAARTADWYVENIPTDYIPFYDFDDPRIPQIARDSSAATIACCALSMLKHWLPKRAERYQQVIDASAQQILDRYLTPGGILMGGSWGSLLRSDPPEVVMPYGNYYIVELVYRELKPDSELFSFRTRARTKK